MSGVFSLDTSCMVAAVCGWHEHHAAAAAEIEQRLDAGERLTVAAHALAEAYAVLTRLPAPHRLSAADAWALVETNFVKRQTVVALDGAEYAKLLGELAEQGISGGRTYDAVIAACASKGKASALLTFNRQDFVGLPDSVPPVEP